MFRRVVHNLIITSILLKQTIHSLKPHFAEQGPTLEHDVLIIPVYLLCDDNLEHTVDSIIPVFVCGSLLCLVELGAFNKDISGISFPPSLSK